MKVCPDGYDCGSGGCVNDLTVGMCAATVPGQGAQEATSPADFPSSAIRSSTPEPATRWTARRQRTGARSARPATAPAHAPRARRRAPAPPTTRIDLSSSPGNCGVCGHACPGGQGCNQGTCVANCGGGLNSTSGNCGSDCSGLLGYGSTVRGLWCGHGCGFQQLRRVRHRVRVGTDLHGRPMQAATIPARAEAPCTLDSLCAGSCPPGSSVWRMRSHRRAAGVTAYSLQKELADGLQQLRNLRSRVRRGPGQKSGRARGDPGGGRGFGNSGNCGADWHRGWSRHGALRGIVRRYDERPEQLRRVWQRRAPGCAALHGRWLRAGLHRAAACARPRDSARRAARPARSYA